MDEAAPMLESGDDAIARIAIGRNYKEESRLIAWANANDATAIKRPANHVLP
jgi:hypothetical protein